MGTETSRTIALPEPRHQSTVSVEQAIERRRSRRAYTSAPVKLAELGQLLWAAQGVTGPEGQRTAPSAGALYPLELYVAATHVEDLARGLYHYDADLHTLEPVSAGDKRRALAEAAHEQACVQFSACMVLVAAVEERITEKYGLRGLRYVPIEAGAAAENILLQAAALGLGTVIVGAFDDSKVARIAELGEGEHMVLMTAVGRPG